MPMLASFIVLVLSETCPYLEPRKVNNEWQEGNVATVRDLCFHDLSANNGQDEEGGAISVYQQTSQVTIEHCSFYMCMAYRIGGCIYLNSAACSIKNCCAYFCWAGFQGHFASLIGLDTAVTDLHLLTIVLCAPDEGFGRGSLELQKVNETELSQANFTSCYALQGSALWLRDDFVAIRPCSYLNIYGCSGESAVCYEPMSGGATIDHSNFYTNSVDEAYGALHLGENGQIDVEWSIFKGNALDITGNHRARVSHCVFDHEIPAEVAAGEDNTVNADGPSWYLYWWGTVSCVLFDPIPFPTLTFFPSGGFPGSSFFGKSPLAKRSPSFRLSSSFERCVR
jgi:hypothetical protein